MSVFTLTAGTDNFTGNAGENNAVFLTPSTLEAADTITGGAAGSFFDILTITASGTITFAQFAGVTSFELLNLSSAGNKVVLRNELVAGTSTGIFAVVGGSGDDEVDASAVTNGTRIAFYAGSGTDKFTGGNGNDYVEFAPTELTAADLVDGGDGFDVLAFSAGGTINAAALAGVSQIEELILSNAGNSVTLSNAFVATSGNGIMSILDGAGDDTVDASGITNGIRVAFYATTGNETFIGGNGSDYLAFHAAELTSGDNITGGANSDIIEFDTAGAVAAGAFTNVTGIDVLLLNAGGNSNVTLSNAMVSGSDNGLLVVIDSGSGNDTLDASAVASNRIIFQSNGGNDSFTGGGGSDVALFTAAGLTSGDTFAGGAGFDVLQLTTAGTVGSAAFTNFTGLDVLFLTLGGNTITLNGGIVANSDNGVFVVQDQSGNNVVDGSAATLGGRIVFSAVAGDGNTYTGGTGSDFFDFTDANLNNTDTLAGGNGAGTGFLRVLTGASVTAGDLANVTQMEVVQLLAGGSIALADTLSNSGSLEADGTAAVDNIDGSAVTSLDLVIKGNGGADTLKGGAGKDQIFLPDTNFVAIDGNGGFDKIVLTAAFDGQTFDLTSQVSKITDVEVVSLESAAGVVLNLGPADISQINTSTNLLYVVGDSGDEVNVSDTGWTLLETDHTNAAVSATHTFFHFHHTSGSDLYVDSLVTLNISSGPLDALDPVANPDVGTAVEDVVPSVSGNVLINDTDDNALTVTTTGVFVGTYGNLTLGADGSYTYVLGVTVTQSAAVQSLAAGTIQTDSFNYTITDQSAPDSSSTLTISVYGTNDAPAATVAVVPNATEDAAYSFNVATLFTDIDSVPAADTLSYSVAGLPAGLSFAGSTISGTPTNDDVGSYTISVTANDGESGSLTRTFSFSVANTNDAPAGTAASYTINEDTPLAGTVAGTDVDGDGLTFALVAGSATNGVATVGSGGAFTFTPAANFSGDATFQFTANDGTADSAPQTVTIHVSPVNDAPTAAGAGNAASTTEDNAIIGNVPAGSDIDDTTPTLTYELVTGPNTATEGSLTFNADGSFLFSPASHFNGAVTFTYRVVDPHGAHSDPQNFTITVDPVNDPVGAVSDTAGIAEDVDTNLGTAGVQSVASGNLLSNDTDGDPEIVQDLDVTAVSGPGTLTNTVTTLTRTDADGSLVIDKETGAFTYTVDNSSATVQALGSGESMSKVFTYTVTDDGVPPQSSTTTFTVNVFGTNDGPVAVADTASVTEDSVLSASGNVLGPDNSGPVNDSDVDGDTLTVSAVNGSGAGVGTGVPGSYGSLTLNSDGSYTYNLTNANAAVQALGDGESLTDSFSYTVSDGHGGSASTTLSVTINGANAAPTISLGSNAALSDVASTSALGVAIADAAATVTDEEARIKAIEVDISSGYQDGTVTTGERAELSALGNFGLSLFGGSASFVDNGNHGTLTITFAAPVSPANALAIFKQVNYVNQIGDFSLAVALDDTRTVTVRVQDHDLAWSSTDTREVNVAANVLDGSGNGTFVGSRFADTINGADGNDTLTGGKGDDTLTGGNNTATGDTVNYAKETDGGQVSETGTQGVIVNLSSADYDLDGLDPIYNNTPNNDDTIVAGRAIDTYDTHDTLSGIENIVGTAHDDIIVDQATASNSYSGGEGTIPAPEVAGDTVVFRGTLGPDAGNPGAPYFRVLPAGIEGDDFTVEYFDPDLGPGGSVLATDTLTDIENMVFDNGVAETILDAENPVWVIEDGFLIGTHTSVAAAVAQANLLGGTTVVEIGHGTTPPADYAEGMIDVTRAMTIKGIGGQQTIHATDDVDLFVVSGSASGLVRFENLALSDDGIGPTADYGIRFDGAYGVNSNAALQVSGVSISGFEQNGLLAIGGGTTVNVAVEQSTFSGNGGGANSGGSGDILFFEYTGAASLDQVTVTGTTSGTPATTADYGIQFAGFHDTDNAIANAIGNVSFSDVSVTGHYDNALVYIEGYNNLSGLSFTATTIGDAASTAGWTGLYVEPLSTTGTFTPSGTTSTLDLSDVTLAGTYGWQTTFQLPGADLILGVPTNDHIIGSASNDAIRTLTGTDAIESGGGNDLIVYDTLPGAKHTVDGGLGTDTQVVFGTAGAETFNVNAISGTQLGINILAGTSPASTVAASSANYEVATTAVEQINIQTGNGGDAVVITGDLQGTGVSTSTITVVGGTGNDTVDASGMLNTVDTGPGDASRVGVDFTGGAGNDTFISNSIGSSDRFDGGTHTTGDAVNYGSVTGGGVSVHLGNQSATDIGGTGVGSDTLIGVENAVGSAQHDVLVGSSVANTLDGGGGDDSLAGNAGNDSLVGGLGNDTADYSLESGTNGVSVDLGLNTATDTFGNTDTLTSIENATGTSLADTLTGGTGANVLTGLGGNDTLTGTGNDTLRGGANDDIYYAHVSDSVEENSSEGTDEVRAAESYTLDANVENLTLLDDGDARTEAFENFDLGPIADGENGWKYAGTSDQTVVDVGGSHGQVLRMSSDPTSGAFGGPYSPALADAAGEPQTTADFSGQSIRFDFKAVDPNGDNSRLEVDFGNAAGTDRNNFMVIEATAGGGIRIAVNEPTTTLNDWAVNDFTAFTGNRTLTNGVDPAEWHQIELRLNYADGADNDLIDVYLDGHHIGTTTTFENFRDWTVGPTHADNAEANQTSRVFFRNSASGAPNDGAGGDNEGFYFDNLNYGVHSNLDGTGNDLANIITGNSGDNTLAGAGANDQLIGGAGVDTARYDDAYANYAVSYAADAHGFITGVSQVQETGPAGAVDEATDTLTGIERLEFSGLTLDLTKRVQLFDGADKLIGTFDLIQDAVDVATDGFTIRLAAGAYTEEVEIDQNIAILGANSGDPGTGSRSAESIIRGQVTVTAAHSATEQVTIDGIEIFNTSNNSTAFTGIQVNSGADVAVKNSIFFSPVPNGSNTGTPDRAIMLTTGASGSIEIDHNLFTGGPSAHNLFSTAAWTTAIWSDGAQTAATIAFNTFEWVRTAINADDFDSSFNVVSNTFQNSGSGISIGGAAGGANVDVASITSIHDNTFDNVGTDFNLQNITAAGKQIGLDLTATNNHAVNTAADAVTVLAGANADTVKGSVGVDVLTGNGGNDSLDGGAGNDGLAGNGADDTLHGEAGDDALFGGVLLGADSGKDTATYDDARANYTVATTTGINAIVTSFTDVTETIVTGTNEGHDTLSGVEVLAFAGGVTLDLTQNVQLFNASDDLIGTFDTIQAAVDAAVDGNTVRLKALTYNENVAIHGRAITIDGVDDTLAGSVITGQITVDTTLDGLLTIKDVLIDATGRQHGVFASANSTALAGAITLDNVTIQNAEQNGFAYIRAGNGTTPALGDTIGAVSILNSAFSNNATVNTGSGGRGDILLFGYNQDLTITDVIIGSPGAFAQKAIQMRGIEGGDTVNIGPYDPAGDVAINNLTITGGYGQDAIAFYRIASFASFTGASNNVNVTRSVNANPNAGLEPWAVINFDEVGGVIDLSAFFASASNLASPDGIVPAVPSVIATPQGLATGDTFTGTSGMDVLVGRGGNDILDGGGGDDLFLYAVGDGNDTVNGGTEGANGDLLGVSNAGGAQATITLDAIGAGDTDPITIDISTTAGTEITASEIEDISITLGANGDTVVINGGLGGTSLDVNTITVNGGTGGDTVDATGLTSGHRIVFNGGGGADTFKSSGVDNAGVDEFNGGGDSDTVDYSAVTSGGITIDLSNTGAQDTVGAGSDKLTDVENVTGTAQSDTIIGNASINTLTGGGGDDTFTGGVGGDTTYGGTSGSDTSAADKAIFSGSSATYTISFDPFAAGGADGIDVTVTGGADGDDSLHGVEFLQFGNGTIDLTKDVLLFDSSNHLIASYDLIQDAVNAADGSGQTIKVRDGLYVEQVTIDATKDGLKIIGESEAGVTVQAPNVLVSNGIAPSNGRNINGVITVDGAENVQVKTLTVDGALKGGIVVGPTNPTMVGVAYLNATGGLIDHVTVTHVRESDAGFGNQRNLGIFVSNSNPSGAAPTTPSIAEAAALKTIEISHTTVTDFQKGGIVVSFANASIHDNTVTGRGLTGLTAQNGIQLAGSTGSVDDNTVTAVGYNNTAVAIGYAILTFNNRDVTIDGNHITGTGVADSSGGIAAIGSTGVVVTNNDLHQVIDAMDVYATASFVDALAPGASNPGGVFDFSSNAVDANVPFSVFFRPFATETGTFIVTGTNRDDELYGASAGDTLNGGAGADILNGRGGADTVNGGGGNDAITWNAGDGNDQIDGGNNGAPHDDVDILQVASPSNDLTLTAGLSSFSITDGSNSANVSEVEEVEITLGGGHNVTLVGDFAGTGIAANTIEIDGSAGTSGETVDASGMVHSTAASDIHIDFTGGSGNDTFHSGVGNDTFHGGAGNDIASFHGNAANATISWNGTTATVTTATDGVDTIDGAGRLDFQDHHVFLVGSGSDYTTIQSAINAASAGDTIIVADGTYNENLTVDKELTILGANHGVAGTGSRSAETVLNWTTGDAVNVTMTAQVTFDGFKFTGTHVLTETNPNANIAFTDSVFTLTSAGNNSNNFYLNQPVSFTFTNNLLDATGYTGALFQPVGTTGDSSHTTVTFTGNTFNGHAGTYVGGDDNDVPLILNLSDVNGTVTGNTFNGVDIGVLVANGTGPLEIGNNTFEHMHRDGPATGNGLAAGVVFFTPAPFTGAINIHDNHFTDMDAGVRTSGVPGSTVAGSNIVIDGNDFTTVANVGFQPVGGVLHFTDSTVNAGAVPSEFFGGSDSDTIASTVANDIVHGNTGADTVTFAGLASAATISWNGTTASVTTGGGGTDTLDGVGVLQFADQKVFLVSQDAGSDITQIAQLFDGNPANGEATAGDTVLVAAGTYNGNFTIGVDGITIKGAEPGVVIGGTFKTDNYSPADQLSDVPLNVWLQTHASYSPASGTALTVAADNVTIENLKIDSFNVAINLGNGVDHTTIKDVIIEDVVNGIRKGTGAQVTDLDLIDGEIRDSYIGMYLAKETADGLDISDVLIDGTDFINLTEKGIYAESLANALITGITMSNVGEFGRGPAFGTAGQFGNGIDINLKWDFETTTDTIDDSDPYSGITIEDFTFTNVGSSDQDGAAASHLGGAAIAVKARNLGSYASPETASFLGAVIIQNGTINGTSTGIRAGEPGQGITDPDVTITNVAITNEVQNSSHGDVDNVTLSPMTVNMLDGGDSLIASPTTTGTLIVNGGTGNDTITTRDGADTINGGGGTDTVNAGAGTDSVIGTADGVNDSYAGGTGTDTIDYSALSSLQSVSINLGGGFAGGASTGTDTLSSFENANGGAGNDTVFGSNADNVLHGNGGTDNIVGSGGSDQLFGEAGTDTLNGGVNDFGVTPAAANDVLWGGADTDTFRFEGRFGDDSIGTAGNTDWDDGEDMVFVGYASQTPIVADVAGGVMITIDDGSVFSSVFVAGANSGQMQQLISGADLILH